LSKLNPENETKFKDIVGKGISYLDSKFETSKTNRFATTDFHYLYTRSFFLKEHPLSKKQDSIIKLQLVEYKKNWLQNSLYQKPFWLWFYIRLTTKVSPKNHRTFTRKYHFR